MLAEQMRWKEKIFQLKNKEEFTACALEIFRFQARYVSVYAQYLKLLKINTAQIDSIEKIPFLPISFFKSHQVIIENTTPEVVFESSGTTLQIPSRHHVADSNLYVKSFFNCFELFFGNPSDYCILALLPSYLERKNSSLVFMADALIKMSKHSFSGFFLDEYEELKKRLTTLESQKQKTLLLGVSFALLDFAEQFPMRLNHTIIMETGGMKGRRKELTRAELHSALKKAFAVSTIYSEYGMTELLSQAYSVGNGIFKTPPWMKILIRNPQDPFEILPQATTGGINIADLANIYSCSFIQTDDLGKLHELAEIGSIPQRDGTYNVSTFEALGRMDNAELRGCNLLLA